jgi:hypothetical protein
VAAAAAVVMFVDRLEVEASHAQGSCEFMLVAERTDT